MAFSTSQYLGKNQSSAGAKPTLSYGIDILYIVFLYYTIQYGEYTCSAYILTLNRRAQGWDSENVRPSLRPSHPNNWCKLVDHALQPVYDPLFSDEGDGKVDVDGQGDHLGVHQRHRDVAVGGNTENLWTWTYSMSDI